jgi:hypothetical protein
MRSCAKNLGRLSWQPTHGTRATRRRHITALFFVLAITTMSGGCKPKAGSKCEGKQEVCFDGKTALVCGADQRFAAVTCEGAMGCAESQGQVACDDTQSSVGEACTPDHEGQRVCSPDGKAALICRSGRYAMDASCKGAKGCVSQDHKTECDASLGDIGEACQTAGKTACSSDKKSLLTCTPNRLWERYRNCRGPKGCSLPEGMDPLCDTTLAAEGDTCNIVNAVACDQAGKSELICQGGKFALSRECKTGCTVGARRAIECK